MSTSISQVTTAQKRPTPRPLNRASLDVLDSALDRSLETYLGGIVEVDQKVEREVVRDQEC